MTMKEHQWLETPVWIRRNCSRSLVLKAVGIYVVLHAGVLFFGNQADIPPPMAINAIPPARDAGAIVTTVTTTLAVKKLKSSVAKVAAAKTNPLAAKRVNRVETNPTDAQVAATLLKTSTTSVAPLQTKPKQEHTDLPTTLAPTVPASTRLDLVGGSATQPLEKTTVVTSFADPTTTTSQKPTTTQNSVEGVPSTTAYKYVGDDTILDCIAFASEHRETLGVEDLNHQLSDDSELPLWRSMAAFFAAMPSRGAYLDIGCGTGRIVLLYAGNFDTVTCVEADPGRIASAEEHWRNYSWGHTKDAKFVNTRFGAFEAPDASYDAISCIQVVQHIPERELQDWLNHIYLLLKPNGVFILATKHRIVEVYELDDGTSLTKEQFNAAAFQAKDGRLAVRSFSPASFRNYAEAAGFTVWQHGYTSYDKNSGLPDTQFVVLSKNTNKLIGNVRVNVPLKGIHETPSMIKTKTRQRKKCKKACPGKSGDLPGDYLC